MNLHRENTDALIGRGFVSPSGRHWRVSARSRGGFYRLNPLGADTLGFGGVKAVHVEASRLDGSDKVWRPR